jgi:RNA-binding protein
MSLTPRQRAHLRSLAHRLKPVVQIGKEGASDEALQSVEEAFNTRELLKIKALENAPETARELAGTLEGRLPGVHAVQVIGRTVVLYRPDPENPEIRLPG